jgi:hypothetical protein
LSISDSKKNKIRQVYSELSSFDLLFAKLDELGVEYDMDTTISNLTLEDGDPVDQRFARSRHSAAPKSQAKMTRESSEEDDDDGNEGEEDDSAEEDEDESSAGAPSSRAATTRRRRQRRKKKKVGSVEEELQKKNNRLKEVEASIMKSAAKAARALNDSRSARVSGVGEALLNSSSKNKRKRNQQKRYEELTSTYWSPCFVPSLEVAGRFKCRLCHIDESIFRISRK